MEATAPPSSSSFLTSLPSLHPPLYLSSSSRVSVSPSLAHHTPKLSFSSLNISISTPSCSSLFYPVSSRPRIIFRAATDEIVIEEEPKKTQEPNLGKKKLYVVNLPWNMESAAIRELFAECGSVIDLEMIKDRSGRNKGYCFVTMATPEEAEAAINKYNQTEISERTIKVEYAKAMKPKPSSPPFIETPHKLYISNLPWKARSNHLRDFFSPEYKPTSVNVIFEKQSGRPAGYGFASFPSREQAEAAISSLNGKELLGREVILKISEAKSAQSEENESTSDASETNELQNDASETNELQNGASETDEIQNDASETNEVQNEASEEAT